MPDILVVIGSVNQRQCGHAREDLFRKGLGKRTVRIGDAVLMPPDFESLLEEHQIEASPLFRGSDKEEIVIMQELFEKLTGYSAEDVVGIVVSARAWADDRTVFINYDQHAEDIFPRLYVMYMAYPKGKSEIVYRSDA